ncbi:MULTISPECIES: MlaA family lipoprotein [unclassified Halomonas]|uniref:MlaA family lipoprotein n=1 Tax=unclassified Halomonas TaxID=2609666 RepID=UPI0006DB4ADA|nr:MULTISPECIES: VacJ family lipoprotein [unclassified Halomonas]KPQ20732.1 MAG: outer membrane lipoprotein required for phospholipid trafficking MlaA [Halomonas sp. HL-93]SBR47790.1 phospholipid-binding lipoprotein MlaA [Halomonas sp. HL-93]SNY95609.1 phospholipid-binding lipoprotein MlaA [Halomonas sp. hl-4]
MPSIGTCLFKNCTAGGLAFVVALALSGCASTGSQTSQEPHPDDPWEGFNRKVFVFNDVLDRYALKPVATGYRTITPEPLQLGVGNFFSNLGELRTTVNSLLQGKPANAGRSTSRFLVNTTMGLGGLFDMASHMNVDADQEDFGQTLAIWGWEDSRYLMLPLLGPSTLRDTSGMPADMAAYPVTYVEDDAVRAGLTALNIVDTRAGLLDQEDMIQGDRYRFIRDAYLQSRQFEISDGELGDDPFATDDFEYDDADFAD